MCLIVFSWQPKSLTPLVLVANRDELYQRAARTVHHWEDHPDLLGGRDLEAGGTWLAVNTLGKFAAVTNFREIPVIKGKKSRGALVSDFLTGDDNAEDYLKKTHLHADDYAGFNLIIADRTGLYYYSNRAKEIIKLKPGLYGLCNHLLETPWPKLNTAKKGLSDLLINPDDPLCHKQLINIMRNDTKAADEDLPSTGVPREWEALLSSCFIASDQYGTRNTSVLTLSSSGELQWTEQNYQAGGIAGEKLFFSIQMPESLFSPETPQM